MRGIAELSAIPARESLPKHLTMPQAWSWVVYRSVEATLRAIDRHALSALKHFSEVPQVGSSEDLHLALCEGQLSATGETDSGFREIPPIEWESLPVAPLDPSRQHPYTRIFVDRDELLKQFGELRTQNRPGAPPKYDWDCVKKAAATEAPMSRNQLAEVLIASFEARWSKRIGLSTMKKYLKNWGY